MKIRTNPDLDPKLQARNLYWQGYRLRRISEMLKIPESTISTWKNSEQWDKVKPLDRVEANLEARLITLINKEHKEVGNQLGTELSDHLANVLRLLPMMRDEAVVNDLVTMMIAPAVEVMMKEYSPSNMEAKDKLYKKQYKTLIIPSVPVGMFLHLIKALYLVLDVDFALIKENKPFGDASFFGFLSSELEVEEGKQSSNSCKPMFDASGVMAASSCGTCV